MQTDAIGPGGPPERPPQAAPSPAASAAAAGGAFSGALAARLRGAHGEVSGGIARVRAEIAAIRSGSLFWPDPAAAVTGAEGLPPPTGDRTDPYGWRSLTREVGDALVAPGFGDLFERQIQQESGFLPEVVTGARRSSAGAEGIAQLMPQYYRWVDRTDPRASLIAGAQTMRDHLLEFGGDLRMALAAYNAGAGRVRDARARFGPEWERGLPQETQQYLAAIVGGAAPVVRPA